MLKVAIYPLVSGAVELTMSVHRSGISISANRSPEEIADLLEKIAAQIRLDNPPPGD